MVTADDLALERNLLRLAQAGDSEAIATLLNRTLNPRGVTAQTRLQDGLLQVLLEAPQLPSQEQWVPFIQQGMTNLGAPVIRQVQIYGRQQGQQQVGWQQAIALQAPPTPYNAVGAPTFPAGSSSPAAFTGAPPQTAASPAVSGQQVAIGSKLLQMTAWGGKVFRSPHAVIPPKLRPRPQPQLYCRPFPNLLDREQELETILGALRERQPVELHGAAGLGKTALLRAIAYHPDLNASFRDGIVYRVTRLKPLEDLQQSLFDDFYEYEDQIPRRPTASELHQALRGQQALIVLDDVLLPAETVHQLLTQLPSLSFLLATAEQQFWGEGMAIPLSHLPLPQAVQLLERALGRILPAEEQAAAEALCNVLQGHPLRIVQAAAIARDRQMPLAAVAQQVGSQPQPESLTLTNAATLPEEERRMLAALGVLGGTPVGAHHLGAMTAVPNPQPVLTTLVQQGLVTTDGVRYVLAGNLVEPLQRAWNLSQWMPSVLRYFQNWTAQHSPVTGAVAQEAEVLLHLAQLASQSHQWTEVLNLVRQADESLAVSGYWGSWAALWQLGLTAAQNLGDQAAIAQALHQLGTHALCLDDSFTANTLLNQALQLREAMGDRVAATVTRHNLDFMINPTLAPAPVQRPAAGYGSTAATVAVTPEGSSRPTAAAPRPAPTSLQTSEERKNTSAMLALVAFGTLVAGIGGFFAIQAIRNQPNFSLTPGSLQFAAQEVNKTSAPQTITLTNNHDRPLQVGRVETTGSNAADFQVTEDCTRQPVAPASTCRIQLTFTPQSAGDRTADLTIGDRAGNVQRTASLRGAGRDPNPGNTTAILNFNPGTLNFGDQRLNQLSDTRRITVTNGGSTPITIQAINTTGAAQNEFKGSETCTQSALAPNATCTLDLQFQPTQVGSRTANLAIADSNGNRWNVPLSGNGITENVPAPALSLNPGQLDFGERPVRTTSNELVLNLTNTGTQPLLVERTELTGQNPGDFSIVRNTCVGGALAANRSCQIGLRFTPGDRNYRSANLRIFSNDPSGTENVFLSGFGTVPAVAAIQVEPTRVNFGNVNLDTASPARTIIIRNTGNAPLQIGNIRLDGNPDFVSDRSDEVGTACRNVTLPPGQSCGFGVVFLPQVAGPRAARIAIPNNAGGEVGVALEGVGAARQVPAIEISPGSLNFGSLSIGAISSPQPVTIRNVGTGPLQIGQLGVGGNNAVDFNPESADFNRCSNNLLQPGASCQFRMFFGPTGVGDRSARLTIPNNSPQGAIAVNLSGVGNDPTPPPTPNLTINPPSLDLGQQPVGSTTSSTVTLRNTSAVPAPIGTIRISNTEDFRLDFSSVGLFACPNSTLPPGEACSFEVIFAPQSPGDRTAQISIANNVSAEAQTIPVRGSSIGIEPR